MQNYLLWTREKVGREDLKRFASDERGEWIDSSGSEPYASFSGDEGFVTLDLYPAESDEFDEEYLSEVAVLLGGQPVTCLDLAVHDSAARSYAIGEAIASLVCKRWRCVMHPRSLIEWRHDRVS